MKFALIDGKRVEAKPELKGLCPGCGQPIIAKCGKQKIHHWAHHKKDACDKWRESETEWHRAWKNHFPADWLESFVPVIFDNRMQCGILSGVCFRDELEIMPCL